LIAPIQEALAMGIQGAPTELFLTTCQNHRLLMQTIDSFNFQFYSMRYQWLGAWTRNFQFRGSSNDKAAHTEKAQDTQSGRSQG
jgi:hypothetical protein